MTDFVDAISRVGFPAACCVYLLWQNYKQDEQRQKELTALRKVVATMQKTLDKMQDAQTENTRVLQHLVSIVTAIMKKEDNNVQTENDET
jgi:hypothetical protein